MNDPLRLPLALFFLVLCAFVASKAKSDDPPTEVAATVQAEQSQTVQPQSKSQPSSDAAEQSKQSTTQQLPAAIKSEMDDGRISEWAWAGVLWSDANLVRTAAAKAASDTKDSDQRAKFYAIADKADRLIVQMEDLGWKRVARPSNSAAETAASEQASLRKSKQSIDNTGVNQADIDQYRVADAEATPREQQSLAEKVESQVEKAVAASSDRGIAEPYGAHISNRETQTRSNTLPYSVDSIYDVDDYDQDGDYYVDNEKGKYASFDDEDLDETVDPVRTITPDVAEVNPEPKATLVPDNQTRPQSQRAPMIDRFTDVSNRQVEDARWVQLHISTNQMLFDRLKSGGISPSEVQLVIDQLRVHLALADEEGLSIGSFEVSESVAANQ
ncbi:hypothetical protein [Roseiconus lacunae]|uniref:hypothetical protein n=1 Tax=Roseiconus lacunae TaxID=2605694 RepID=UPI0011F3625F|nr:hypothetical protein [Roseiconus lacunae]